MVKLLLCAAVCVATFPAMAQNSSNLTNSTTVMSACTIATVNNISFVDFDPLNVTFRSATGSLQVYCSQGSYSVSRNLGQNTANFSKSVTHTNTNGTPQGNVSDVTLVCTSSLRGREGRLIEYKINNIRPTIKASFKGTGTAYDSRNCVSGDSVVHQTLTFNENKAQNVNVTAYLGNATDKTNYKSLLSGVYTDTLTFTVTF